VRPWDTTKRRSRWWKDEVFGVVGFIIGSLGLLILSGPEATQGWGLILVIPGVLMTLPIVSGLLDFGTKQGVAVNLYTIFVIGVVLIGSIFVFFGFVILWWGPLCLVFPPVLFSLLLPLWYLRRRTEAPSVIPTQRPSKQIIVPKKEEEPEPHPLRKILTMVGGVILIILYYSAEYIINYFSSFLPARAQRYIGYIFWAFLGAFLIFIFVSIFYGIRRGKEKKKEQLRQEIDIKLKELKEQLDSGTITAEEYENKKRNLLELERGGRK